MLRVDPFLWRGIVLVSFTVICPETVLSRKNQISKLIGSDTIDLSNFRSLVGMLKGPDALLEFKRVNNVLNFKFCDWI